MTRKGAWRPDLLGSTDHQLHAEQEALGLGDLLEDLGSDDQRGFFRFQHI